MNFIKSEIYVVLKHLSGQILVFKHVIGQFDKKIPNCVHAHKKWQPLMYENINYDNVYQSAYL